MTVIEIKEAIRIAESSGDKNKAEALRKKLARLSVND